MPPIVPKMKNIETSFVNAVKAQTSGQITFEYATSGLRIRPANMEDHASISTFSVDEDIEFHIYDPNPGQQVKSEEILAALREKDIETSHVRQVKRNLMIAGIITTYLYLCGS